MSRTARCRDSAGTLVLDLASTGYEIDMDGIHDGARTWVRQVTRSPYVDGVHEMSRALDGNKIEITVRVNGSTWVVAEQLRQALLAAVEVPAWLLEIEVDGVSYTYRANAADSVSGLTTVEMFHAFRTISLTIPVQPTPAITGI